MNTPSIKTLTTCFADPKEAKRIFLMTRAQLMETPKGAARFAECYNPPKTFDIRMTVLNSLENFHGVESCETVHGEYMQYLNTGDTYAPTVIYWRQTYRIQSVASFIETREKQGILFK